MSIKFIPGSLKNPVIKQPQTKRFYQKVIPKTSAVKT